jgi:hypothetical protein
MTDAEIVVDNHPFYFVNCYQSEFRIIFHIAVPRSAALPAVES